MDLDLDGMVWNIMGEHGEGESCNLEGVRSINDPSTAYNPLLVTLFLKRRVFF